MRIGVYGGSFDPIHLGHLLLAEQCREAAALDSIRFVPAATPPHKLNIDLSSPEHRLAMLRLAIGGHPSFEIETCELDRQGVSFTVDTLKQIKQRFPNDELFLLMGADSLDEFHTWQDPETICQLATPIVVERPGSAKVDYRKFQAYAEQDKLEQIQSLIFESRMIDISSREIRSLVEQHRSIRYLTPSAVERYILEKGIFAKP